MFSLCKFHMQMSHANFTEQKTRRHMAGGHPAPWKGLQFYQLRSKLIPSRWVWGDFYLSVCFLMATWAGHSFTVFCCVIETVLGGKSEGALWGEVILTGGCGSEMGHQAGATEEAGVLHSRKGGYPGPLRRFRFCRSGRGTGICILTDTLGSLLACSNSKNQLLQLLQEYRLGEVSLPCFRFLIRQRRR